jgi:hypothetical protein
VPEYPDFTPFRQNKVGIALLLAGPAGPTPERVLKVGSGKKAVQEHQAKATTLSMDFAHQVN